MIFETGNVMVISKHLTFEYSTFQGSNGGKKKSKTGYPPRDGCQMLKLSTNKLFQMRNFMIESISKTKQLTD